MIVGKDYPERMVIHEEVSQRNSKWMKEYGQQLIGKMERTPAHCHPSSDAEILKMVFAEDTDEMDKSSN